MDLQLAGKKALVTAASQGIRNFIDNTLAAEGADVWAVGGGNLDALNETINRCATSGVRSDGKGYDFSKSEQGSIAVEDGVKFLGGLDILVNCAGTRNFKPILEVTDEEIHTMFEVNTKSFYFSSREAAKTMSQQKSGDILMMGSISGHPMHA